MLFLSAQKRLGRRRIGGTEVNDSRSNTARTIAFQTTTTSTDLICVSASSATSARTDRHHGTGVPELPSACQPDVPERLSKRPSPTDAETQDVRNQVGTGTDRRQVRTVRQRHATVHRTRLRYRLEERNSTPSTSPTSPSAVDGQHFGGKEDESGCRRKRRRRS